MDIRKQAIPNFFQAALPSVFNDVAEYLTLEESEDHASEQLTLDGYYIVADKSGFLVFRYESEDGPGIAFAMHALGSDGLEKCSIGSWPFENSVEASINELLEVNPQLLDED